MDLRSQIQRVALRWPAYGYRLKLLPRAEDVARSGSHRRRRNALLNCASELLGR